MDSSFSDTQHLSLLPISENFLILWVLARRRKLPPPPTEARRRQAFSIPFPSIQGPDLYVGLSHSDASIWNSESGASDTKTGGWPRWSLAHGLGSWQRQVPDAGPNQTVLGKAGLCSQLPSLHWFLPIFHTLFSSLPVDSVSHPISFQWLPIFLKLTRVGAHLFVTKNPDWN